MTNHIPAGGNVRVEQLKKETNLLCGNLTLSTLSNLCNYNKNQFPCGCTAIEGEAAYKIARNYFEGDNSDQGLMHFGALYQFKSDAVYPNQFFTNQNHLQNFGSYVLIRFTIPYPCSPSAFNVVW